MPKIDELKQRGAALVAEAREIQDNPKGENGKLTPEQRTKRDNLLEEAEGLRQEAQTEERMNGVESWVAPEERGQRLPERRDEDNDGEEETPEERTARSIAGTEEYRNAFYSYCRRGDGRLSPDERNVLLEVRALSEGVDADGGYVAPEQLVAQVDRDAQDIEQLAPRCDTIQTGARAIKFNREDDAALTEWGWVAELGAKPESQPALDQYQIDVHTAAGIVRVSEELLEDSVFGLEAYLGTIAAERKVMVEETSYLAGTGSGQPWGILTRLNGESSTPHRYTTATIGTLAGDDFVRMLYSLPRRFRMNASFVLGSQALLAARLLKDGNDNYIWAPGLVAGEPDRILGKTVIESPDLALDNPIAAGNDVGLCGDLSRYRILRRLQMQVMRLNELYAATDEVGFRFRWRVGGDVRTTEAFRTVRVRTS